MSDAAIPKVRVLREDSSDSLSPNNPLSNVDSSQNKLVTAFYMRVRAAESAIPDGVILRIFRAGSECQEEATALIQQSMQRQRDKT